jgi:GDP-L-fucose synthase
MKIFLTGGSGFLGQHMVRRLEIDGHSVVAPSSSECNLTISGDLSKFVDRYDAIFHLAAYTQAGDWCLTHPGEQWIINQQINTNILNWWQQQETATRMVAIGTSCSYAPASDLVETEYMNGEPIESLYTYAMTKRMLLQGLRAIHNQYNLDYLYVVPSTLYGAGYHQDGRQMHFIFDLIRKILRGREFGETVTLWGDGHQSREIVHVDDFITNLFGLFNSGAKDIYNLGSGTEHSIRNFANVISDLTGYDFDKIQFDTTKYVGAKSKVLNNSKASTFLSNYSGRSLESGIRGVIEWFEKNQSFK